MRPLIAEVNLAALKYNFSVAQQAAPDSRNFAVIKADAYGHGAVQCAQALQTSADGFAVASIEEAVELRIAKISLPILVLSAFSQSEEVELLAHYELMPVVHSIYQLDILAQNNQSRTPIECWLKIDSGMNRLGLNKSEYLQAQAKINGIDLIQAVGVMSHFACSDETHNNFTQIQINNFSELTDTIKLPLSLANSCAVMAWPASHKHWNRPGIMLYGTSSIDNGQDSHLQPVMRFYSQIIAVKNIRKGQSVGYGQTFVADKDIKVGVVACGYADGYPRGIANDSPIVVNGYRTRILGRVSMDTMSVDLSLVPQAQVGDQVELWGERLAVREVADAAQTIPYELLTRVSKRVPRVYLMDVDKS